MDTFRYLYDKHGNQTALQIELSKLQSQIGSKQKDINNAQIELLKLFAAGFPDEYLSELKKLIADFMVNKILNAGDSVWEQKGYTKNTFDKFVEND